MSEKPGSDGMATVVLVHGAFAPEEGETLGDVEGASKDSVLNSALVTLHYPSANGGKPAVEFAIDPAKFHEALAAAGSGS